MAKSVTNAGTGETSVHGTDLVNSYRNLQWSTDGTCLLATDCTNTIKTYVVPVNLLDHHDEPLTLEPYYSAISAEPVSAVAGVPFFDLQAPSTALVLSSARDHPLCLSSALTGEKVASYPLVNPLTEQWICPNALSFSVDGRYIIAGSESLLSVFDISASGSDPLHSIQTGPKKLNDDRWNPTTSIRGIISTLDVEPQSGLVAAGTFSRQVGLYDNNGSGDCVGAFSLAGNAADEEIGGRGITQVKWSPCGRYLYVAERKSDGIMLYDIRNSGQLLAWCKGRNAVTNQRLSFDLSDEGGSLQAWAGGTDGIVRVWTDLHSREGAAMPDTTFGSHAGEQSGTRVIVRGLLTAVQIQ